MIRNTSPERASQNGDTDSQSALNRLLIANIRKDLDTITRGWRHVLDPITSSSGIVVRGAGPSEPVDDDDQVPILDPALDVPRMLAFWVRAAIDEWPALLTAAERVIDTDESGAEIERIVVSRVTLDISNPVATARFLAGILDRFADWDDGRYLDAMAIDTRRCAASVASVAWPPRGDRVAIGECPCGRPIRVSPTVTTELVPQPTTDPAAYPLWRSVPTLDPLVRCHGCDRQERLSGWIRVLRGTERLLDAEAVVAEVHAALGMRYQPATVRQWARRGMISTRAYAADGRALYDRVDVLTALMVRESQRLSQGA